MEENIKKLLDKINIDETSYQYFNDARMTKIKVKHFLKKIMYFQKINMIA